MRTAPVFSDNMVLQRHKNIRVFGSCTGRERRISVSIPEQSASAEAVISGSYTEEQRKCLVDMIEVMKLTKSMLKPGNTGREIDSVGRKLYDKGGYLKYLVCPFAHTMGLMEAEAPFFGPNSDDVIEKNMIVNIDVSFFGHPTLNGLRVETCYVITEDGAEPLCPEFEQELLNYVK